MKMTVKELIDKVEPNPERARCMYEECVAIRGIDGSVHITSFKEFYEDTGVETADKEQPFDCPDYIEFFRIPEEVIELPYLRYRKVVSPEYWYIASQRGFTRLTEAVMIVKG